MSWKETYESRKMSAAEAVTHIKSGDRVVVSHMLGAPLPIIQAMVDNYQAYKDVRIQSMLTFDNQIYADEKYAGHFYATPMFAGPGSRKAIAGGYGDFICTHFSKVPELFRTVTKPDVTLVMCTPPDENGYVSLGITADYTYGACKNSRTIIAEVNSNCPYTYGDTILHVDEIECFVESDRALQEVMPTPIGKDEEAIASFCAEKVVDGACLQLGLGAIPDAILSLLDNKKDLGIHTEICGDAVVKLFQKGVINCSRKEIDKGKIVTGSLHGSNELFRFADHNKDIEVRTVDYTNDVRVISQLSNVVSINSCVEVDMTGQVNSEAIGPKQFSGVGGQVDFVRGATMSPGGISIIACYSTAKNGTISRIVPALKEGTCVTTPRTDVDYVVTEYGIAALRGKTFRERANALISIAHPDFRDQLRFDYKKIFGREV